MIREPLPRPLQIEGQRIFIEGLEAAINTARDLSANDAVHWRQNDPTATEPPTLVGAVVLGMDLKGRHGWFNGANRNLAPGDNPTKICGEPVATQKMVNDELPYLIGAVVAGTTQPDKHSGRSSLILPTCGLCRPLFQEYGDEEYTLIVQSHLTKNIHEIDRLSELHGKHNGEVTLTSDHATILNLGDMATTAAMFDLYINCLVPVPDARRQSVATIAQYALGPAVPQEYFAA